VVTNNTNGYRALTEKIVWGFLAFIVGWLVFNTVRSFDFLTYSEIRGMIPTYNDIDERIRTVSPYLQDRKAIMDSLAEIKGDRARIFDALERNHVELLNLRAELKRQ
jgi:uncharacterized membrane protein